MKLARLPSLFLLRSLVRELRSLREIQTQQIGLLTRLADHFAPLTPTTDPIVVREETGLAYRDDAEQALILDYVSRTVEATGHVPTDDEILIHLSDEKTIDLHRRLADRDREIAQLRHDPWSRR